MQIFEKNLLNQLVKILKKRQAKVKSLFLIQYYQPLVAPEYSEKSG